MHSKTIIVSCGDAVTPERAATLFSSMDADVRALKVPPNQALDAMRGASFDMLLIDDSDGSCDLAEVEAALSRGGSTTALFVVMKGDRAASVRLPVQIPFDFACEYASDDEVKVRCRRLLWPGEMTSDADFVHVGSMTINLATYQVKVAGEPVDLTFMEYALLAFLATHPGRIYSREVLLSQVWGFDYYGGTRTVDVHIRRLRAKLGPEMAQHIETVRGAGYLWEN